MHVGGVVLDPECNPLSGAAVVIWQTDDDGRYRHPEATDHDKLDPNFLRPATGSICVCTDDVCRRRGQCSREKSMRRRVILKIWNAC